jgi:hypothetical protein
MAWTPDSGLDLHIQRIFTRAVEDALEHEREEWQRIQPGLAARGLLRGGAELSAAERLAAETLDKFAARATREVLDALRDVLGDIPPAAVEWIRQTLATRFDGFAKGRGATLIEQRARMNVAPDGARELVDRAAPRAKRDLEITIQPIEVLRTISATFGHGGLKGHFPHRGPEPNVDHARA